MQQQSNQQPSDAAVPQDPLAELGRDDKALANLVGFFDVLIQMDFAQKRRNERKNEDAVDLQDIPKDPAQTD